MGRRLGLRLLVSRMLLLFSCSVVSTLCDPMDCSTPGFPVLRYLPEFVQTHVHWTDDAIQPSHPVISFSSCLQSFLVLVSFLISGLFALGGQSIGASASASILPMNVQDWFPLELTSLISLQSKGLSRVFLQHHSLKASILRHPAFFIVQLSHPYMTTGKTIALTMWTLLAKCYLCFLIHQVCPSFSSKKQMSFNLRAAVTIHSDFGAPENVCHCFYFTPSICHEVKGPVIPKLLNHSYPFVLLLVTISVFAHSVSLCACFSLSFFFFLSSFLQ